jgi:predicted transposase YbfD/YdcC
VRKWAAEYVREQWDVPGCRSVIRLDKETCRPGEKPKKETRYYMSSLDPDKVSAKEFQSIILGHWEIENCLHGTKDRYYSEDKHGCGEDWGTVWTILTNMALSLVKLMKKDERTLKDIRERSANKPVETASKLGYRKKTC